MKNIICIILGQFRVRKKKTKETSERRASQEKKDGSVGKKGRLDVT